MMKARLGGLLEQKDVFDEEVWSLFCECSCRLAGRGIQYVVRAVCAVWKFLIYTSFCSLSGDE